MPVQMKYEPNDICVLRISGILKRSEFGAEERALARHIVWRHFWAIQIILFLLILVYCTARELARVFGKEKMIRLFFGPAPTAGILSRITALFRVQLQLQLSGVVARR